MTVSKRSAALGTWWILLLAALVLPSPSSFRCYACRPVEQEAAQPPSPTAQAPRSPVRLSFGYNAFQLGVSTDEKVRGRIYTNLELAVGRFTVGFQGLNEASPSFGWNTVRVGFDKIPFKALYTTRHAGENLKNLVALDHAFGVRVDISKLPLLDYGYVDFLKNIGRGSSAYAGYEASTFVGKELWKLALESLFQYQGDFWQYWEVELLGPAVGTGRHAVLRPYVRLELPGTFDAAHRVLIGGIQLQKQ